MSPTAARSPAASTPGSTPGSSRTNSSVGTRSHTMFISRSTTGHFSLPRERSNVVMSSHNVALVDFNQLRAGSIFDNMADPDHAAVGAAYVPSPRFDLLTPATDSEVQDIINQKSPDKLKITLTHVTSSETPSSMSRAARTHEMMGRVGHGDVTAQNRHNDVMHGVPSPRLGLYTERNQSNHRDNEDPSVSIYCVNRQVRVCMLCELTISVNMLCE